jgi:hypothetical protein
MNESVKEMGHQNEIEYSTYDLARISTRVELNIEKDMIDTSKRLRLVSNGQYNSFQNMQININSIKWILSVWK